MFILALVLCLNQANPPLPGFPGTVVKGAKLETEYADDRFFEGPTWDPQSKKLFFTAFGKETQILRLESKGKAMAWADKTEGVNGTFLTREGRLLGAQAFGHRLIAYTLGADKPVGATVLLFQSTLNQPNDVCQAPNGDTYFTDPDFKKREKSGVFLLKPNGTLTKLAIALPTPNGIKVSMDGKTLMVSDSHLKNWHQFPINPGGATGEGKMFFDPKVKDQSEPDGLTLDEKGNWYLTGRGGVWVVNPQGKALGFIPTPTFCSNVAFGGEDGKTLYFTCSKQLLSLAMNTRGATWFK
ncbi:MAG: hypothetical protein EXR99_05870 [Gemmataceae bacterium]|nr:hypothetical protein [Gemmataceae bacterium]